MESALSQPIRVVADRVRGRGVGSPADRYEFAENPVETEAGA